jgi:molybdopterin converting factor subunit 1
MVITVRFFATLRDRAGDETVDLELPNEASVRHLLARLAEDYPALDPALDSTLVAVNHEFAFHEDPLADGDEVALFPPVSGG